VVTTPDDFDCTPDLSDSVDVLCSRLDLLNTLTWSRYLPHRKSGSKGDSILSPGNRSIARFPLVRGIGGYRLPAVGQRTRLESVAVTGEANNGYLQ